MILFDSVVQLMGFDSDRFRFQEVLFDRKKLVVFEIDILCDIDKLVFDIVEQGYMMIVFIVFDNYRFDSDNIREQGFVKLFLLVNMFQG